MSDRLRKHFLHVASIKLVQSLDFFGSGRSNSLVVGSPQLCGNLLRRGRTGRPLTGRTVKECGTPMPSMCTEVLRGSAFLPHIVIVSCLSFDRCPCQTLSLGAPYMMWPVVVMLRMATSPIRSIVGRAVSSAAGGGWSFIAFSKPLCVFI